MAGNWWRKREYNSKTFYQRECVTSLCYLRLMYKDVLCLLIMTDNIKYAQQTEKLSKISAKTRISKQLQYKRIHVHENQAFFCGRHYKCIFTL